MATYIIRRSVALVPLLFLISVITFVLIQLPPGDYVTTHMMNLRAQGTFVAAEEEERLREQYGLGKSMYQQYFLWIRKIVLHWDFGTSFAFNRPVADLLAERVPLTLVISLLSAVLIWVMAVPIGIYSATHQYSKFDFFWTFVGFIGLATPNFLVALVFLWFAFYWFDISAIGLFSAAYQGVPWSVAKVVDLLKHTWIPVLIVGTSGTAGLIRVMRGTLLDELNQQYVVTARVKGLSEPRILFKYPVRMAINPVVSTLGWMLPSLVSGEVLVSTVMSLPTTGPLLLEALLAQDMFMAGSIVLILSALTVVGTLISDILLVWLDPRIRYD